MDEWDGGHESGQEECRLQFEEVVMPILRDIEWGRDAHCPECVAPKTHGHSDDCAFGNLLKLEKPWVY